jgi:hypothetical protein
MPDLPSILLLPDDAGREIYRVRPVPGPLAWLVLAAAVGAGGVAGRFAAGGSPATAAGGAAGIAVLFGLLYLAGYLNCHRVCENALVLGLAPWPGGEPYVIPWTTVDPATLTVHQPLTRPGSSPGEPGERGVRAAFYSRRGVSVGGLHADLAHPRRRSTVPAAAELLARYTRDPGQGLPATRWVMGVRDPEPLVRAIASVLSARGLADADLAERVLASPVSGGAGDRPQDPPRGR